ncbi:hypothetical protein ACSBR2_006873 [Camellia fascicularis]
MFLLNVYHVCKYIATSSMVPGMKISRRKKPGSGNNALASTISAHHIATPLTFSDDTQLLDDTQTVVEETQAPGAGKTIVLHYCQLYVWDAISNLNAKECKKKFGSRKGKKLHVYVNRLLNAMTGGNATLAANELGLQIRRLCPLKGVKSWNKIDQSIKDAVVQAVLVIIDLELNTNLILVRIFILTSKLKRSLIERRIFCTRIGEKGVDDPYSHLPTGVCLDDWKHMINMAWKDESHLKRSKASKPNRSMLSYNRTSGSQSFPIAMSSMDEMVNLQVATTEARTPLTQEELSRQVFGQKKNYLRGFGISPQPSSLYDSVAQARDKHMEAMRAKMEVFPEEREKDHEELMKEKEERRRAREEMIREREEMMKQVEGKKTREAQQEQLNHLNNMVLQLTTLLQGPNGHHSIW